MFTGLIDGYNVTNATNTAVAVLGSVMMENSGPSAHHPECLQLGEDVQCEHVTVSPCNVCDNSGRASAVPALHQSAVSAFSTRPGHSLEPLLQSILSTTITTLALSDDDTLGERTGGLDMLRDCLLFSSQKRRPLFLFAINRYIYRIVNLNVIYFVFNNHIYLHYID